MNPTDLIAWCSRVAQDFHQQESILAVPGVSRDTTFAEYVLDALGDVSREGSDGVFKTVKSSRTTTMLDAS